MTNPSPDPLDAPTSALAAAVLEIARHIGDAPLPRARCFALASASQLLAQQPALASVLGEDSAAVMAGDDLQLLSIELDEEAGDLSSDPLESLAEIAWPQIAVGAVLACELSAEQWAVREQEGSDTAAAVPRRSGALRVVVGVLEDGTSWSALQHAEDEKLTLGPALLPQLTAALKESLQHAD